MMGATQPPIRIVDGRLMVEDQPASRLAARFGTPIYVHSEAQLRANVAEWRDALAESWRHGPTRVLASLKANPSVALRRILNAAGAGCDVFGAAELEIALHAGVDASQISVNGSTKSPQLIGRAISVGARLTVDSIDELAWAIEAAGERGGRPEVRVRLRPDLTDLTMVSEFTESEPVGEVADAYKPGIPIDELIAALPGLDISAIDLAGVHAHLGRHTSTVEPFRLHAERLAGLAARLGEALGGWRPRQIDLGGGFSFAGDPTGRGLRSLDDPPAPAEYAAALAEGLERGLRRAGIDPAGIEVEIEPGRAIYGNSGLHLATVLNVKRQAAPVPRTWVGCDSSEVLLSDLSWEHSGWRPICADPVAGDPVEVDVTGRSCGFDTISAAASLPSGIAAGDVIAFLATGAYEEALAGNFNSIPRPASVLVSGRDADLIRSPETARDVQRRDRVPGRLRGDGSRVLGVDHVSVAVADIDRSLGFYRDLLGLTVRERGVLDPGLVARMTGVPDAEVEYADVELGSRVLELLHFRAAQPQRPASQRLPGAGGVHIGLRVEDAAAVHERLTVGGFEPLSAPVLLPQDGSDWSGGLVFYVRDPDGVMIEIVERAVGHVVPVPAVVQATTAAVPQR
jgi:diaminopimelate decarboxylase/catechol 2,3-dioxygenase-like lactoylglutathione lyase family enzyme